MKKDKGRSIGRWISIIHRQFQIYINNEIKQYDLNSSEYIYLISLGHNEGVNQKYFSDQLCIDDALTTRVMKSLEHKGYITRSRSERDKRAYSIRLTGKGAAIQPVIIDKLNHWTEILSKGMDGDEVDYIIGKLQAMSQNAVHETKKGHHE